VIIVRGQDDLLKVVLARHGGRGFADLLDGGEEQADEDGDDSRMTTKSSISVNALRRTRDVGGTNHLTLTE